MGQEYDVSRQQIIRDPSNYAEMIAKLKEQDTRAKEGVLNKHKVSPDTDSNNTLLRIAKDSVAARSARTLGGHRTETPTETRQPVQRDHVFTNSQDPEVLALQNSLRSEIERSKSIASQARITNPQIQGH